MLRCSPGVVNLTNHNGATLLRYSANRGYAGAVRLLLAIKAEHSANEVDQFGVTPIFIAAELGHTEVVQILLDSGLRSFDFRRYDGVTPLLFAAEHGHTAICLLYTSDAADE